MKRLMAFAAVILVAVLATFESEAPTFPRRTFEREVPRGVREGLLLIHQGEKAFCGGFGTYTTDLLYVAPEGLASPEGEVFGFCTAQSETIRVIGEQMQVTELPRRTTTRALLLDSHVPGDRLGKDPCAAMAALGIDTTRFEAADELHSGNAFRTFGARLEGSHLSVWSIDHHRVFMLEFDDR